MQNHSFNCPILILVLFILLSCGEPPIEWQEAQTGKAETKSIELADGSIAHLNENSYLKYPVEFTQTNRAVELTGEAFFEVKNEPKTFLVDTGIERVTASVAAEFNVNTQDPPGATTVNVASGGVTLRPNKGEAKIELEKGIKGIFDRQNESLQRIRKATGSDMYWHTKRLEFNETYLARVIDDLVRIFNAEITISNPDLAKCLFTYAADNATLKDVMEAMEKDFGVDVFEETETVYSLTGGECN